MEKNIFKILSLMKEIQNLMKDSDAIALYIDKYSPYLQLFESEIENAEIVPVDERHNKAKTIINGIEVMKIVDKEEL